VETQLKLANLAYVETTTRRRDDDDSSSLRRRLVVTTTTTTTFAFCLTGLFSIVHQGRPGLVLSETFGDADGRSIQARCCSCYPTNSVKALT